MIDYLRFQTVVGRKALLLDGADNLHLFYGIDPQVCFDIRIEAEHFLRISCSAAHNSQNLLFQADLRGGGWRFYNRFSANAGWACFRFNISLLRNLWFRG